MYTKISKHKYLEIVATKRSWPNEITLDIFSRGDHKGVFIFLAFLGYQFEFNIYDIRHES